MDIMFAGDSSKMERQKYKQNFKEEEKKEEFPGYNAYYFNFRKNKKSGYYEYIIKKNNQ